MMFQTKMRDVVAEREQKMVIPIMTRAEERSCLRHQERAKWRASASALFPARVIAAVQLNHGQFMRRIGLGR